MGEEYKTLIAHLEEANKMKTEEENVLEIELQIENKELKERNNQLQGEIDASDERENKLIEEGKEMRAQLDSLRK